MMLKGHALIGQKLKVSKTESATEIEPDWLKPTFIRSYWPSEIKKILSIEKKNVDFVKLKRKVHLPYIPPRILRNYATGKSFPNADCKFLYPMADSKFRSQTSYKSEIVDHERLLYRPR